MFYERDLGTAEERLGRTETVEAKADSNVFLSGTPLSRNDSCGCPEVGHNSGRNRLLVMGWTKHKKHRLLV